MWEALCLGVERLEVRLSSHEFAGADAGEDGTAVLRSPLDVHVIGDYVDMHQGLTRIAPTTHARLVSSKIECRATKADREASGGQKSTGGW